MTRGPNNTAPLVRVVDPDRTDPGEPPSVSANADKTDPSAWSPEVTPSTPSVKSPDNTTDPGLDPMLEAFNRPPRPPAPQPNLRSSSDGDEFAAHYASPREMRAPQAGPTARDPAVLVQLAQLARRDTAPLADPTPEATVAVHRDVQMSTVVRGKKRSSARTLLVALAVGGMIAAPAAFFIRRSSNNPELVASAGASSAAVLPLPRVPSAESPLPSSPPSSPLLVPAPVAVATAVPAPPATVRSALPTAPPVAPTPATRPASSASPRPVTSEHVKPPAAPRPAYENPDTVL